MTNANPFRQESLEIPCPACGHKFPELLAFLEQSPSVECPNCHSAIQIDGADLHQELAELDEELGRAEQVAE